jgi:type VI secretion system protein ImpK
MYICLSLGFQGRFRILENGRSRLDELREKLYGIIRRQRGEFERELSPRWRGLTDAGNKISNLLPAWLVAAAAAVILALVFMFFRMDLNRQSNPLFAGLNELTLAAVEPQENQPDVVRTEERGEPDTIDVCTPLREEADKGLIDVECEPGKSIIRMRHALFDSGADQPNNTLLVDYIGKVIKDKTRREDILVVGHTDSVGKDAYNLELSKRRALNVANRLVNVTGDSGRYQYSGRGETEPMCTNDTADGRACNRRVEITIYAPNQSQTGS